MKGLYKKRKKNHNSKIMKQQKKRFFPGASCYVVMGNGCYSAASIQQLVPNPLGRNASPILSLCLPTLHSRLPALCGSTVFLLFSAAVGLHALHCCRGCTRVNGPDFCRGHSGHINMLHYKGREHQQTT